MRNARRRSVWAWALASVLVVSGLSATTAPAIAAGANNLIVSQDAAGTITINQGSVLQAGSVVKAQFNTAFAAGDLEIMQLAPGVTWAQVDQKIAEAGQGGAVAEAAIQWFAGTNTSSAKTTFYGGRPFAGANKFDRILPPGTYYVTQLRPSGNIKPSTVVRKFTVVGTPQAILPVVDGKVSVVNTNGPDLFSAYSISSGMNKLKNGPITLINKTGSITSPRELHFFDFTKVPAGTTPAQACALVTAQGPGNAASFGTLSTQQVVNGYLNVPLGTYWITSWIPDSNSGTPHALECDGTLVEVVA